MPLFSARVLVSLRPSVLDPAGEATRAAAGRLGVDGISRLRITAPGNMELQELSGALETVREVLADVSGADPVTP